ncbi:MAG: aminotransferase class I/II-fold pyridoxal phosphate-dependent enzyme [Dysgonamonadaceae bacterium]
MKKEKVNFRQLGFSTRSIHLGNDIDKETGAIRRPITMANSYALPYDPTDVNWSEAGKKLYTRNGGANQEYLQEKLAALHVTEDAVVLATGVAALHSVFFSFLNTGDHIVAGHISYIAVYRLLNEYLPEKYKIETTLVDSTNPQNVADAIRPNTKLIHIETPGNPIVNISDIAEIAKIAHANNILLSVDNTFASPFNQLPSLLGADLVVESLTKYINGHGDAMGGAVLGKKILIDEIRRQAMINVGGAISPFNAWLIMRGAVTLPLRMRQHNANALEIAKYLEKHPKVAFVSYPGLKSHPQHGVAKKQMSGGYSGLISFGLNADFDAHNRFVENLNIITSAVSLGHDESLIVFLGPNDERQYLYPDIFKHGFFRLSIGLEDADDLIADLEQALQDI